MENQSVFIWLLNIVREEEDAAGREVFSLVDGYQGCVSFSLSEACLSCLEAAELKKKICEATKETGRFQLEL